MSIETQLREALSARADEVSGPGGSVGSVGSIGSIGDPYLRVSGAVAVSRRRRRTAALAGVAAVVALAVAVPTVAGGLGRDTTMPAKKTSVVVPGPNDPRWATLSSWPTRGSLAGDRDFLASFREAVAAASVIYAGDLGADRVVVTWERDTDQGALVKVYAGDRGTPAASLTSIASAGQYQDSAVIVRRDNTPDGWLLVLAPPAVKSAEVSPTVTIHTDGTVTRSWESVALGDGGAVVPLRGAPLALIRVRVGGYDGGVSLPARSGPADPEAVGFCGNCVGQEYLDHALKGISSDVATTLGLRTQDVTTTTLVNAEVDPAVLAVSSLGNGKPDGSTGRLYVALTHLPGGQVVRTVEFSIEHRDGTGGSTAPETAVPLDAATAEQRPFVLSGPTADASWTRYQVFAPNAASVRLVGDQPGFGSTATKRLVDGTATFSLPETGVTEHHRVQTFDASGALIGTWPIGLLNDSDPYDVQP